MTPTNPSRGGPEDKRDNVYHLAHMIALLGPPPKEFLERITYAIGLMRTVCILAHSHCPQESFTHLTHLLAGNWREFAAVPKETLKDAKQRLTGEEEALFLSFAKKRC